MKRLALVGAGGFVGARFVEMTTLDSDMFRGVEIVPIIRQPRGLGRLSKLGVTNYRMADAANSESLVAGFAGCDAVVNLTMGDNARIFPDAQNLHAACITAKVPLFIHLSSAEVFGRCDTPNLTDDSPWLTRHWMEYAREKGKTEDWLRNLPANSTTVVTLRPGLIWGPRSPWVVGPAKEVWDGRACLIDDGKWACNLCHVNNLIHAILDVVRAPKVTAGFYNVGDPDPPDWRTYYIALASEMGLPKPFFHKLNEADFKESLLWKLLALKNVSMAKAVKRRFRNQTKAKIKFWLLRMERRRHPATKETNLGPELTKAMWWLQTTRYHLPTVKFQSIFQPSRQMGFAEGMVQTGEWLRFSGFCYRDSKRAL